MKLKPPVKQIVTSDFADVPDEKFSELLEAIKECPDQFEEPKHAKESKSKSTSKTRPDSMPRGN